MSILDIATIGMNPHVLRQTEDSKFSHFGGSTEYLLGLAVEEFPNAKEGYRDGVVLVSVPASGFFSGVVSVTSETELRASYGPRRNGEESFVSVSAMGAEKLPAAHVDLVLYRRDVLLEEGPDAVGTLCDWELVSINARPTQEPEPMTPMAMARNMLNLTGGTKAEYTGEEFAKSVLYWSTRVMAG